MYHRTLIRCHHKIIKVSAKYYLKFFVNLWLIDQVKDYSTKHLEFSEALWIDGPGLECSNRHRLCNKKVFSWPTGNMLLYLTGLAELGRFIWLSEHLAQKMPPQFLQWCFLLARLNSLAHRGQLEAALSFFHSVATLASSWRVKVTVSAGSFWMNPYYVIQ